MPIYCLPTEAGSQELLPFPTWVAGIQLLESALAAFQGLHSSQTQEPELRTEPTHLNTGYGCLSCSAPSYPPSLP